MSRRDKIQLEELASLKAEFRDLLIRCLEHCAGGAWGLFGAYDSIEMGRVRLTWPEADQLCELADSIQSILAQSGERDPLCDAYVELRAPHGANKPGEPKLAKALLDRITSGEFGAVQLNKESAASH
jgi:hypothetical protein